MCSFVWVFVLPLKGHRYSATFAYILHFCENNTAKIQCLLIVFMTVYPNHITRICPFMVYAEYFYDFIIPAVTGANQKFTKAWFNTHVSKTTTTTTTNAQ